MLFTTDKVVAIEKLRLVGEDGMVPSRCTEGVLYPCLLFGDCRWVVCRCWTGKENVVVIEQELVSFVQTRLRFAVSISERVLVYEYSSPFASILSVVNPSDDGH